MSGTRSSALWLNDALSMASSSTSTSTSTQRLLPTPHAQLNELSAFLASSSATSAPPAPQTFLDDLLRDEDGHHQLLQNQEDCAVSSAMTEFFSLGEETHTTTYSSSSSCSPSTPPANPRLLQLETNYERKKNRAKINRKDLNSRFQELMDILHLKEDRKLNRAKILEKTIEHIEKLTAELNALKAGHLPQDQKKTGMALQSQQLQGIASAMVHSMGQHSSANGSARAPLLPYNPSWNTAAVGSNLSMPMMWMPVVTSSGMAMPLKRAAPGRVAETRRKRGRVESVTTSEAVSRSGDSEHSEVGAMTSSTASESTIFEWGAQEIPTILSYCDAWTLVSVMRTSRGLRRATRNENLWGDLCCARWRIPPHINIPQPFEQWQKYHSANRIPDCTEFTHGGQLFASGRAKDISVWGLLAHRSNGQTTRAVVLNSKATVMQVVGLFVVVQNLSHARVRITDCISLTSKSSTSEPSFQAFTAASGAHLMPTVVAVNSEACVTTDLSEVVLHHGDLCVLRVFMECPGLELEDHVLQRAGVLNMQCKFDSGDDHESVDIRALCKGLNDYDKTQEKVLHSI